ncbi:Olfactory receptor 7A17 [Tupaia chinensis]|uniref:Olfactory receptor 7A17 n=1 Tax=Tupaia chinensis TaxID=246437 RepID=L8YBY3_TUPCH|nr:Olfactory receptor 7A17 [Tupaia chinensis]
MEPGNDTQISEFLLLGFSEAPELQLLILGLFISMYLITVCGNLLIILATISDSHLHTPMYFFLSNLSLADICFTSTTVPKMLVNIQTQSKVITYAGCITQMFFFILFGEVDDFLLTVMAYDRYVAICHPLHYTVIMNSWLCRQLVLASWTMSVPYALLHSLMALRLSFCTHVEIPHFFCEFDQVIYLDCSETFSNDMVIYFGSVLLDGGPLTGIFYSYSKIIFSICAISSTQGKYQAFSTCASHLSVVSLFYCTGLGVYLSSGATHRSHSSAAALVMYSVFTPMLNPFIYSLRNKDIKRDLKKLFRGKLYVPTRGDIRTGFLSEGVRAGTSGRVLQHGDDSVVRLLWAAQYSTETTQCHSSSGSSGDYVVLQLFRVSQVVWR